MDKKFCVITVCYNNLIANTEVVKACLSRLDNIEVVIFDNSTLKNIIVENMIFSEKYRFHYLGKNKNLGLSLAYNYSIEFIKEKLHIDWITIFDQDTKVTTEYFDALEDSIDRNPGYLIYAPLICCKNGLMSPLKFTKNSQRRFDIIDGTYSNLACINSGTTINILVYNDVGIYDEKLFLDLVDYDFFRRFNKIFPNKKIKVLEYEIEQEFSGDGYSNFATDYNRFKIYILDFNVYCDNWRISFLYRTYIVMKRAIKLTFHYKNICFIKYVFKNK